MITYQMPFLTPGTLYKYCPRVVPLLRNCVGGSFSAYFACEVEVVNGFIWIPMGCGTVWERVLRFVFSCGGFRGGCGGSVPGGDEYRTWDDA